MATSSDSTATSNYRSLIGLSIYDLYARRYRCQILREITRGESGTSYEVRDLCSRLTFALKLIPRGENVDTDVEREILNHSSLVHPGIVPFKEVFLTPTYLAVLMERIDGSSLLDSMEWTWRRVGVREYQARHPLQMVVATVDFCHRRGIYNRNIKPANIFVQGPVVKLSDFSFSKSRADSFPHSAVGTAGYMAPEAWVAQPHRPYCGVKADVWSCGVLLYTLAFGLHPFEREDDAFYPDAEERVYQRIRSLEFQYPRFSTVSESCRSLIAGMLVVDPAKRMTLQEVMAHPWFRRDLQEDPEAMNEAYLLKDPYAQPGYQSREEIKEIIRQAKFRNWELSSEEDETFNWTLQESL